MLEKQNNINTYYYQNNINLKAILLPLNVYYIHIVKAIYITPETS